MKKDIKRQSGHLRAPIVVILGHVDHGKTTLLDAIRKTNVAKKEAGGITQSIGASVVTTEKGRKITFIDTPGHAAFAKMSSRGAKMADIAILVVAADDGVKPQAIEALEYIKEVKVPMIVAVTKIDLPSADVENVRDQLVQKGVLFEKRGGDTPLVAVCALKSEGLEELLEMIILLAELNEIRSLPEASLSAVIIETGKDKKGVFVSVVIRDGTLKVGDRVVAEEGEIICKVKGLFDWQGKGVKKAGPGEPIQILGFSVLPHVGSRVEHAQTETSKKTREVKLMDAVEVGKEEVPVVIKTDSAGSLEAVLENIPEKIVVVSSGIGDIVQSDVFLAKAAQNASIFVFKAKVSSEVLRLAETEGIKIERFEIIYKLFERLEELVKSKKQQILGEAEILQSFPFDNKKIAGLRVKSGKIGKSDKLILMRGDEELGQVRAVSMKKQKETVSEVKEGEEFGVIFEPQLDFEVGDMLVSVRK